MLSFEVSPGGALEIYFDEAGRNFLAAVLSEMKSPGDHFHLFSPTYGGEELSKATHHPGNRALEQVSLGIPGSGLSYVVRPEAIPPLGELP